MLKKIISAFVMASVSCLFASNAVEFLPSEISNCSFCDREVLQNQKIYEDDQVIVLVDYKPVTEGHCLVIPKRHVERLENITSEEMVAVHAAISKLYRAAQKTYQASAYLILQKNGKEAGQDVPHVHFHFLPRKAHDYTDVGIYARLFFLKFKNPLSQEQIDLQRNSLSKYFIPLIRLQNCEIYRLFLNPTN